MIFLSFVFDFSKLQILIHSYFLLHVYSLYDIIFLGLALYLHYGIQIYANSMCLIPISALSALVSYGYH